MSKTQACTHEGAAGPCLARVRDGRCVWCERALPPLKRRAACGDKRETRPTGRSQRARF